MEYSKEEQERIKALFETRLTDDLTSWKSGEALKNDALAYFEQNCDAIRVIIADVDLVK